ncbi:uncharacterized protein JCM10292_007417 [Rhodotorula paludigena]|uniref:uncharacterized protein n=1 Tax=Rhodotorula paludigena TaxID=86838 RepID=UPI00317578DB
MSSMHHGLEDNSNVLPDYVTIEVTYISTALAILGFYLVTVGQFSYLIKSRLLMSSALIALCLGIAVGPIGLDWVSPWKWTNYDDEARFNLTFQITRLVIGIQVMFAGIDLPAAYLRREAWSLFMLLIPIMTVAWFVSAGFVLLFVNGITFLEALAIAACITPTDPILANAIVKGRYAEKHVPKAVRDIISAESGANDGLGYPFLFLAVFLMQRSNNGHSISLSLRHWVVTTWLYQIALSVAMGAIIGYLARKTLKIAYNRKLVDHESFLAYGVGLALFTLGVVGLIGSDDILACFVAGNSLTWKDFFRIEKEEHEDTFQDVIDGLLDTATFIYIGTIIPWSEFSNEYLTPWKLVLFAICILLFRRLPAMMAVYKIIPALEGWREGIFAGWFGPIGVSALYYAILALHVLPEDRIVLRSVIFPVVIFMAMGSTIVHGITIPITKGVPLAVTRTRSITSSTPVSRFFRSETTTSTNGALNSTPGSRAISRRNSLSAGDTAGAEKAATGPIIAAAGVEHPHVEAADGASEARDIETRDAEPSLRPGGMPAKVEFSLPS